METNRHMEIEFKLNGVLCKREVPVRRNLVDFLRHDLGLTGTHVGCESGICGACNVREVETIEGVVQSGEAQALHKAFVARNALQCGYCTPGMIMTGLELINSGRDVDRTQIREEISGNFCRCTGYQAIVDAIEMVVTERRRK